MNYTIKDLPEQERPYEKCEKMGAEALSDAELLAVILRTGTGGATSVELAREVLKKSGSAEGLTGLCRLSLIELCQIRGIGKVKALQLKCIAELSRRIAKASAGAQPVLHSAWEIADYCMEDLRYCEQEEVLVLCFASSARLLSERRISRGTVNQSLISPREIFMEAMRCNAAYVILVHNHPSGDATPSREDFAVTERLAEAGRLFGIELMDHIVIGDHCYYSFREHGFPAVTAGKIQGNRVPSVPLREMQGH